MLLDISKSFNTYSINIYMKLPWCKSSRLRRDCIHSSALMPEKDERLSCLPVAIITIAIIISTHYDISNISIHELPENHFIPTNLHDLQNQCHNICCYWWKQNTTFKNPTTFYIKMQLQSRSFIVFQYVLAKNIVSSLNCRKVEPSL